MSAKRGASGLSGILLVDKPQGPTSHDVVARIRRASGERRVGHAGTLDPMATGLLVVLIGPAARLEPYLSAATKRYTATIRFGTATDTDDAQGQVTGTAAVPAELFTEARARATLDGLIGESMQRPPAYSAIKVGGVTAHRAARSGEALELAERPIRVDEARLLGVSAADETWQVAFTVSKGTYIRALARDIGESAGTVAHLSALRRTASGPLGVDSAHTIEAIEQAGGVSTLFCDPREALTDAVWLTAPGVEAENGRPLDAPDEIAEGSLVALSDQDGALKALYRRRGDRLVAETVFATPVSGGVR